MTRRFLALVIVWAMGLQGPLVAYATASTLAGAALSTQADCPGGAARSSSGDSSCCPHSALASACCAGSVVFTTPGPFHLLPREALLALSPPAADALPFATERPGPELRPPIV